MRRFLIALSLAFVACLNRTAIVTTTLYQLEEAKQPRTVRHLDDGVLTTIEGAGSDRLERLPSGDLIVTGWAEHMFVMRVSPSGQERWRVTFDRCAGLLLALADDAIYVVARASTIKWEFMACDPQRSGEHGMVYKLDEHGTVLWHVAAPIEPQWLIASATGVIAGDDGAFAVTAGGQLAWTRLDPLVLTFSAAWATRALLVLAGNPRSQPGEPGAEVPCFLRAIDPATGHILWEQLIEPADSSCIEPVVEIRGAYGVVRTRGGGTQTARLTGFESMTGALRWRRELPLDGTPFKSIPELVAPFAPDDPIVRIFQLTPANVYALLAVAIDPATGAAHTIGAVTAELKDSGVTSLLDVNEFRLEQGTLFAIGSFTGRLSVGGMHALSPHRWRGSAYVEWRPMMFLAQIPTGVAMAQRP